MIDNNLRCCREELGMTQQELGAMLNTSKQMVSNWETGLNPIPINNKKNYQTNVISIAQLIITMKLVIV